MPLPRWVPRTIQVGYQSVRARRVVQLPEGLSCQHSNEANHVIVVLRDEDLTRRFPTPFVELRARLVGHQVARTEIRINQSLELLQCHNALPQSRRVARFVLP